MLFNSVTFLLFLPITFILYWFVFQRSLKLQNFLIVVASFVFYGWWDWRFLFLLLFTSMIDFYISIQMDKTETQSIRKRWLLVSIVSNMTVLGFFKYYNFFANSWVDAWASVGYTMDPVTVNIILPVGISFYTFQALSYTIDVYRKDLKATRDLTAFLAFISFFPQLVAGPIERATNLLPQILQKREFSYQKALNGVKLILWGMFKKVVIADSLAVVANDIFQNYTTFSGGTLVLGAIFFAFQIYCDFSGYTDIAIGTSKLFGFEMMSNFKFPYFSRDIAEFWRRWHISLSTWFRDYIYIPLGGSRVAKPKAVRNVFIIFLLSGFWHGANWTYLAWGGIHALLFIPLFVFGTNRKHSAEVVANHKMLPSVKELFQIILTFSCVTVAWVFFRAPTITDALHYISRLGFDSPMYKAHLIYVAVILALDWINRRDERHPFNNKYHLLTIILMLLAAIIFRYQDTGNIEFIYFQF